MKFILLVQTSSSWLTSEWWMVILTGALVFLTFAYVIVTGLTLRAIGKQNETAERATSAAHTSADAALIQAQVMQKSQRAWIMVRLDWVPGQGTYLLGSSSEGFSTNLYVRLICTNEGQTPAWITQRQIVARVASSLPHLPDLSKAEIISEPLAMAVSGKSEKDVFLMTDGQPETIVENTHLYIYGVVTYRDAFQNERETYFGYVVRGTHTLERVSAAEEYNKNT